MERHVRVSIVMIVSVLSTACATKREHNVTADERIRFNGGVSQMLPDCPEEGCIKRRDQILKDQQQARDERAVQSAPEPPPGHQWTWRAVAYTVAGVALGVWLLDKNKSHRHYTHEPANGPQCGGLYDPPC